MVRPDIRPILQEIAETGRRVAEIERCMHDMTRSSIAAIVESRELLARIDKQLQKR